MKSLSRVDTLWASLQAASIPETAVFSAFKQVDASLSYFVQLQRFSVTEELDLVIAMGSPKALPAEGRWILWTEDRKVGLFLQEKNRPERVYLLGTKPGFPGLRRAHRKSHVYRCCPLLSRRKIRAVPQPEMGVRRTSQKPCPAILVSAVRDVRPLSES